MLTESVCFGLSFIFPLLHLRLSFVLHRVIFPDLSWVLMFYCPYSDYTDATKGQETSFRRVGSVKVKPAASPLPPETAVTCWSSSFEGVPGQVCVLIVPIIRECADKEAWFLHVTVRRQTGVSMETADKTIVYTMTVGLDHAAKRRDQKQHRRCHCI